MMSQAITNDSSKMLSFPGESIAQDNLRVILPQNADNINSSSMYSASVTSPYFLTLLYDLQSQTATHGREDEFCTISRNLSAIVAFSIFQLRLDIIWVFQQFKLHEQIDTFLVLENTSLSLI